MALLLMGTLAMASSAQAKPFKHSYSGWCEATEIDTNGDGVRASSCTVGSEGTFGPATRNSHSEIAPVPSGFCDGDAGILKFEYLAWTAIMRFQNGDGLVFGLDHGTLCYNPAGYSTFEVHAVILGGSGRFEGATGSVITSGESIGVVAADEPDRTTHSALWGSLEGEIFLAH